MHFTKQKHKRLYKLTKKKDYSMLKTVNYLFAGALWDDHYPFNTTWKTFYGKICSIPIYKKRVFEFCLNNELELGGKKGIQLNMIHHQNEKFSYQMNHVNNQQKY